MFAVISEILLQLQFIFIFRLYKFSLYSQYSVVSLILLR